MLFLISKHVIFINYASDTLNYEMNEILRIFYIYYHSIACVNYVGWNRIFIKFKGLTRKMKEN